MRIYISGGCKNGKSTFAEKIAFFQKKEGFPLYYIATMNPVDDEDKKRIKKHIKSRENYNFETLEVVNNINFIKESTNLNGSFLLDSTTALLMNEMFTKDGINNKAYETISKDLTGILKCIKDIVIVSDYIFSDSFIYDECTEDYRKGLAYIDKNCAKICDVLIEVCYNSLIIYKGKEVFNELYKKII